MATALDLIKGSMRLIGSIATGETPDAAEANEALDVLNQLLESLSTDNLVMWNQSAQLFSTVASQSVYTIGAAGNFVTTKPVRINGAFIRYLGTDYPVQIITQAIYDQIYNKTQTAIIPTALLYVDGQTTGSITLWPVPSSIVSLSLDMDSQFTSIPLLSTVISWPAGYYRAIRYQLALELAAEYGLPVPPQVAQMAMDAMASIKRVNNKDNTPMSYDSTLTGYGGIGLANFLSGNF